MEGKTDCWDRMMHSWVLEGEESWGRIQHDHTDLLDTLDDGVRGPRDGHCPLCGVGQHVPGHLDLGTCGLERLDVGWGWSECRWQVVR